MDSEPAPDETAASAAAGAAERPTTTEIGWEFLRISLLGFGGPNAHLALMLAAVVERRRWIDREHFLHLVGMTHLLPGPNSSEVAIHIGYTQRGWRGALAAGSAFLGPTFVIMLGLSALYFRYGTVPGVEPLFWGLKPAIVAVILGAGWRLGRTAVEDRRLFVLAAGGAAVALLAGRWQVAAMLLGGAVGWWLYGRGGRAEGRGAGPEGGAAGAGGGAAGAGARGEVHPGRGAGRAEAEGGAGDADPGGEVDRSGGAGGGGEAGGGRRGEGGAGPAGWALLALAPGVGAAGGGAGVLGPLFLLTLGIGATMFGGGYVLVALLQPYAVERFAWLDTAQFLDGVALSQAVPGPISTLAAFVGFAAAGVPGAVVATLGIYIPALVAVLLVAPHLERWRHQAAIRGALRGINAVVAGAVVGTALALVPPAVPDMWAAGVLAIACLAVARGATAPQLVLGGLAAGLVALASGHG